jgi:hypothetical protein
VKLGSGPVTGKDAPRAMPSPAPGQAREGGLDRTEIEEPAYLRLVHGVAEPALAHHVGQVHERASHARRRYAAYGRVVVGVDQP